VRVKAGIRWEWNGMLNARLISLPARPSDNAKLSEPLGARPYYYKIERDYDIHMEIA
jgi:hypothetical protein